MKLFPVTSSNIAAIGYESGIIEVHFLNGAVYHYPNCTKALFESFLSASSKGKFLHQWLKGRGEYVI
ncbi:KTSC domain-containing protein [uncultured Veillonella sp.]|uniref:KTSC domain-containing protein n=1 Tax=uncultured Veillonella sp. TaxID=159268 RepID=UPI0025F46EEF|nr:KTSC domain-containing protein [uncultured Veillonella sp.]MDY3974244.1 KTSC domain-containing protein [Veillonella caviae]